MTEQPTVGSNSPLPDPPAAGGRFLTIRQWLYDNNPLYLASVMCMFFGLYYLREELEVGQNIIWKVVGIYGIQNIYEILIVAMGLYLLRRRVNLRHGRWLIYFSLIFLHDVTFYQVRISVTDATLGWWVSIVCYSLALVKMVLITRVLAISWRPECFFYFLGAVAIIFFGPKYLYSQMDLSGKSGMLFDGFQELYVIFLLTALIQLPIIVGNWWSSSLDQERQNPLWGDERELHHALVMLPFLLMPFHLFRNLIPDVLAVSPSLQNTDFLFIPSYLGGIFLIGILWRKTLESLWSVNNVEFLLSMVVLGLLVQSEQGVGPLAETYRWPFHLNRGLLVAAHSMMALTRRNLASAALLLVLMLYTLGSYVAAAVSGMFSWTQRQTRLTWGVALISTSFVFLVVGFILSLRPPPNLGSIPPQPQGSKPGDADGEMSRS